MVSSRFLFQNTETRNFIESSLKRGLCLTTAVGKHFRFGEISQRASLVLEMKALDAMFSRKPFQNTSGNAVNVEEGHAWWDLAQFVPTVDLLWLPDSEAR